MKLRPQWRKIEGIDTDCQNLVEATLSLFRLGATYSQASV